MKIGQKVVLWGALILLSGTVQKLVGTKFSLDDLKKVDTRLLLEWPKKIFELENLMNTKKWERASNQLTPWDLYDASKNLTTLQKLYGSLNEKEKASINVKINKITNLGFPAWYEDRNKILQNYLSRNEEIKEQVFKEYPAKIIAELGRLIIAYNKTQENIQEDRELLEPENFTRYLESKGGYTLFSDRPLSAAEEKAAIQARIQKQNSILSSSRMRVKNIFEQLTPQQKSVVKDAILHEHEIDIDSWMKF